MVFIPVTFFFFDLQEMLERRRVQERLENKADNIISKTLEGAIDRALGQIGMNEL